MTAINAPAQVAPHAAGGLTRSWDRSDTVVEGEITEVVLSENIDQLSLSECSFKVTEVVKGEARPAAVVTVIIVGKTKAQLTETIGKKVFLFLNQLRSRQACFVTPLTEPNITPSDPIIAKKLTDLLHRPPPPKKPDKVDPSPDLVIPDGMRAIPFGTDCVDPPNANLNPGDKVDLLLVKDTADGKTIRLGIHGGKEVLRVNPGGTKAGPIPTVTILVWPEDVETVVNMARAKTLRIVASPAAP